VDVSERAPLSPAARTKVFKKWLNWTPDVKFTRSNLRPVERSRERNGGLSLRRDGQPEPVSGAAQAASAKAALPSGPPARPGGAAKRDASLRFSRSNSSQRRAPGPSSPSGSLTVRTERPERSPRPGPGPPGNAGPAAPSGLSSRARRSRPVGAAPARHRPWAGRAVRLG